MVFRIYSEKKGVHAVESKHVCDDLRENLNIAGLTALRIINRYDVEGAEREIFEKAIPTVFSEPPTDNVYETLPKLEKDEKLFAVEYLPGQYDQRADSCAQCIQILSQNTRPTVRTAKIYLLKGDISDGELEKIKKYLINPVEARETSLDTFETLEEKYDIPETVETIDSFRQINEDNAESFIKEYRLAMDKADLLFCRDYFISENRNPTITELRMIDSYWSDHCRHTTFLTAIDEMYIDDDCISQAFDDYLEIRSKVYGALKKPVTLMDMATVAVKYLKRAGKLPDLDESEEINACSVKVKVKTESGDEDWILMFKNETHNHPTEIEPFGGAATCLGGAIRDPLSGRSYVYQAMRVTGAGDVTAPVSDTMKGKLPQSKISLGAASGYSSYGNQIGLATGGVYEIYHSGYTAKRMEIGAVVGAAPAANIIRKAPAPGDVVVLLGGRTGRDGCGGATGSSKAHDATSLSTCGAEVQKGNPLEERKLQRLFRNPEATKMVKRCNDFGAGGVSVAIGELADGLYIDLSRVPKKYEGLVGTELAISESQERMAVVVSQNDLQAFCAAALEENLEATVVATVTADNRLTMTWNGRIIVNLTREFLNSNGAQKHTKVAIPKPDTNTLYRHYTDRLHGTFSEKAKALLGDMNICSQKGLMERFDSSIGASTVVMPYGGKYQLTPSRFMAAKLPYGPGKTTTSSVMSYGFNPYVSEKSPFHGAVCAVVESVTNLIAAGANLGKMWLTFQEYFERLGHDPYRWGKPAAAMLGALKAQLALEIGSIGGKDSMSGSFEDIDVPPTLVSFAVSALDASEIITPELKSKQSKLWLLPASYDEKGVVDFEKLKNMYAFYSKCVKEGKILSAWALGMGGLFEGIFKMAVGNKIGVEINSQLSDELLYNNMYGAILVESENDLDGIYVGRTNESENFTFGDETVSIEELCDAWTKRLEKVFPTAVKEGDAAPEKVSYETRSSIRPLIKYPRPRVLIPVFPGTNCEFDTAAAFEKEGAQPDVFVFKNITPALLEESINALADRIDGAQILMLPGGFSGGDEPDGSGKFITAVLRNPKVRDAVSRLLEARDGLALGICNGFQALIKLGLLPYGKICDISPDCPTLTFNSIGRHQSKMVYTRVASVKSPWLSLHNVGDVHTIPVSHGEGRFWADDKTVKELVENGQVAFQYVDMKGEPSMDTSFNPNASVMAIEGICSPDGRVLGKMGHSERCGEYVAKNVPGNKYQLIFRAGVEYYK